MFPFIMIMSLGKVHVPVAMHPTHLSQKDGPPTRKKKNETLFLPSTAKSCEEGEEKKSMGMGAQESALAFAGTVEVNTGYFSTKKKTTREEKTKRLF